MEIIDWCYLYANESKCALIVAEETPKVVEIDTNGFAADLVALELKHGPVEIKHFYLLAGNAGGLR